MKLISSKKTKRRIALMFVFAFMLSNLLSLIGPNAQAAVTISQPSAGTCFQHSGTVANGALVTVYNVGTIQISLTASEITPGQDTTATVGAGSASARATNAGSTSATSDIWGNVFTIIPPTGTNFVIVPGFQDTLPTQSANLLAANATISNAASQDGTNGTADQNLGISVGVISAGTSDGIGRAIVAIARDADSSVGLTAGAETYPKSGTGNNSVTISINGLGIAIPPSGDGTLSGTLTATLSGTIPSGLGLGGVVGAGLPGTYTVSSAISGLTGSIPICTVSSAAGQVEAVLDADDDSTEAYDKSGTSSANLLALGSVSSNTRVFAFDTGTLAGGVSGTSLVDVEPILIRGIAGTSVNTRDQVIATGELLNAITAIGLAPSGAATPTSLDLATYFGNSVVAPITIAFADDNASATTVLQQVDIVISQSTAAATPTQAGFNATQTSRSGFLGALRAALDDGASTTAAATNTVFNSGAGWGVASISGGPSTVTIQEVQGASGVALGGLSQTAGNVTEPFNSTFIDLRLECSSSTNPVSGWFAVLSSTLVAATAFGTTDGTNQIIRASQAGNKFVVNSVTTLFTQALTQIAGSNPVNATSFNAVDSTSLGTTTAGNAILYASCANNTLTLFPVQNGFDGTRDFISITPKLQVTNISSTFSSDVNLLAEVSGNNLTGTTSLMLAKLVGAVPTGTTVTSNFASASGVGVAANSQLGVTCSSGGESSVVLSGITTGTVDAAVTTACTSGAIATPSAFFTGGAGASVSGSTVIDGSPTVQGEARGILVKELSATGFNELVSQVGGGTQGTVFEVSLPTGCDIIDDRDDNNTAVSSTAATGGNDVTRTTVTQSGGVTAAVSAGGAGDAALTNANVIEPASGSNAAKLRFRLAAVGGATDNATTDAVLLRLDSQDIFCPTTVTGDLTAMVTAQNKVSSATVIANLGSASLGTAKQALTFAFGDDTATSTKGEVSTNSMLGATPRLAGGSTSTSHTFTVTENDPKGIPIGGRSSARNMDPDNSVTSSLLTRGQIWIIPAAGTAFSAAPVAADVSFSDNSLVVDGNPLLVSTATIDANAPLGSILVGVKRNTASGAADPATSTTTVTVKNLGLTAATSSTTDLVASALFFSQDAGVVVNTPGSAAGNSATTPTVFTPFAPGSTKALTQVNGATAATATLQLGSGTLANSLLTSRLTTQGSPQLNPFAKVITSAMNADASKITVTSTGLASSGTPATDNVVTVTGAAGAVDGGAQVIVATGGSTTYDSTTVTASEDGSFTAKVRGDCTNPSSISVSVTEQVSGTKTTAASKTVLCSGTSGDTEDTVFSEIAGTDGTATIDEVLSFVSGKGGLSAIITSGGAQLAGVIKAVKSALGLS